jgi:hypothetical protein
MNAVTRGSAQMQNPPENRKITTMVDKRALALRHLELADAAPRCGGRYCCPPLLRPPNGKGRAQNAVKTSARRFAPAGFSLGVSRAGSTRIAAAGSQDANCWVSGSHDPGCCIVEKGPAKQGLGLIRPLLPPDARAELLWSPHCCAIRCSTLRDC